MLAIFSRASAFFVFYARDEGPLSLTLNSVSIEHRKFRAVELDFGKGFDGRAKGFDFMRNDI